MAFQNTCRNLLKAHRFSRLFPFSTSEVKNVAFNKHILIQKNPYVKFLNHSEFCVRSFTSLNFASGPARFLCVRSDICQRYCLGGNLNCATKRYCTNTGKYAIEVHLRLKLGLKCLRNSI